MKVIAGLATFKGREWSVEQTINSLRHQVDEIIVYDNEVNPDLTDNGKFYGLTLQTQPCIYLSCDDDLIYPPDYAENMVQNIERYKCIVTHHGRRLSGLNKSYYRGHPHTVHCLKFNNNDNYIDVAGTGVCGFSTEYFNPLIHDSKDKKMSDLVFSLEAAKHGKDIVVLKHKAGWIRHSPIDLSKTIHATESNNEHRQIEIANEIYKLRYGLSEKRN